MKVYLLMERWEEYMDSDIYGIFSTYEKALERANELFEKMVEEENLEEEDLEGEDFKIEEFFDIIPFEVDK